MNTNRDAAICSLVYELRHLTGEKAEEPLYSALMAWETRRMPPSSYREESLAYQSLANGWLDYVITTAIIKDQDIFAANLLGWITYSSCSHEGDAHAHFRGSIAMLNFFLQQSRSKHQKPISDSLMLLGPFVIDCANAWTTRNGAVPHRSTTFEQRVKYFDEWRRLDNSGAWYSGILEAANSTLGNLLEVSLSCVFRVSKREEVYDFTRDSVDDVLSYVRAELGDVDLHNALHEIDHSFQRENTNHTTVEGQLITRLFHRLKCILLLLTILEEDSIQQGVTTFKTIYLGKLLVCSCRAQSIRRGGPIEDYYLISWHNFSHLLLGGMVLSWEENSDRKKLLKVNANTI